MACVFQLDNTGVDYRPEQPDGKTNMLNFLHHLPLIMVIKLYSFVQPLESTAYYFHHCRTEIVFSVDETYTLVDPYNQ
jgi:hypothetical protein